MSGDEPGPHAYLSRENVQHERRTIMTRLKKLLAAGALVAAPLALAAIPAQPAHAAGIFIGAAASADLLRVRSVLLRLCVRPIGRRRHQCRRLGRAWRGLASPLALAAFATSEGIERRQRERRRSALGATEIPHSKITVKFGHGTDAPRVSIRMTDMKGERS